MGMSKNALKPAEGVYYILPKKNGTYGVYSLRSDESDQPLHMFYWEKVLNQVAHEYNLKSKDIENLKTSYMAIPRGRVQKEYDKTTLKETGNYIVIHGGDVPLPQIKHFILQDFGLISLSSQNKVKWEIDEHEKMDPEDKKAFEDAIKFRNKNNNKEKL